MNQSKPNHVPISIMGGLYIGVSPFLYMVGWKFGSGLFLGLGVGALLCVFVAVSVANKFKGSNQ